MNIMNPEERKGLVRKLAEIDVRLVSRLEEEVVDPYETTLARLRYANLGLTWPLKTIYPR